MNEITISICMNCDCQYFRTIIKNKTMYPIGNNCRKYKNINECIDVIPLCGEGIIIKKDNK